MGYRARDENYETEQGDYLRRDLFRASVQIEDGGDSSEWFRSSSCIFTPPEGPPVSGLHFSDCSTGRSVTVAWRMADPPSDTRFQLAGYYASQTLTFRSSNDQSRDYNLASTTVTATLSSTGGRLIHTAGFTIGTRISISYTSRPSSTTTLIFNSGPLSSTSCTTSDDTPTPTLTPTLTVVATDCQPPRNMTVNRYDSSSRLLYFDFTAPRSGGLTRLHYQPQYRRLPTTAWTTSSFTVSATSTGWRIIFNNESFAAGRTFEFRLVAICTGDVQSAPSNVVSYTYPGATPTPTPTPMPGNTSTHTPIPFSFTADAICSNGNVSLSWNAYPGAIRYVVIYAEQDPPYETHSFTTVNLSVTFLNVVQNGYSDGDTIDVDVAAILEGGHVVITVSCTVSTAAPTPTPTFTPAPDPPTDTPSPLMCPRPTNPSFPILRRNNVQIRWNTVDFSTPTTTPTPETFTVSAECSGGDITLSWNRLSNAHDYELLLIDLEAGFQRGTITTSLSFTFADVSQYGYHDGDRIGVQVFSRRNGVRLVRGYDECTVSGGTDSTSTPTRTRTRTPTSAPETFTVSAECSGGDITLSWNRLSNAHDYDLFLIDLVTGFSRGPTLTSLSYTYTDVSQYGYFNGDRIGVQVFARRNGVRLVRGYDECTVSGGTDSRAYIDASQTCTDCQDPLSSECKSALSNSLERYAFRRFIQSRSITIEEPLVAVQPRDDESTPCSAPPKISWEQLENGGHSLQWGDGANSLHQKYKIGYFRNDTFIYLGTTIYRSLTFLNAKDAPFNPVIFVAPYCGPENSATLSLDNIKNAAIYTPYSVTTETESTIIDVYADMRTFLKNFNDADLLPFSASPYRSGTGAKTVNVPPSPATYSTEESPNVPGRIVRAPPEGYEYRYRLHHGLYSSTFSTASNVVDLGAILPNGGPIQFQVRAVCRSSPRLVSSWATSGVAIVPAPPTATHTRTPTATFTSIPTSTQTPPPTPTETPVGTASLVPGLEVTGLTVSCLVEEDRTTVSAAWDETTPSINAAVEYSYSVGAPIDDSGTQTTRSLSLPALRRSGLHGHRHRAG